MCVPRTFWACLCIVTLSSAAIFDSGVHAESVLTLGDALAEALESNVALQAERLRIQAAAGERRQAGLLFQTNPELEFERGTDRGLGNDGEQSLSLSISQELEVWGQRGKRKRIADFGMHRSAAEVDRFIRLLETELSIVYHTYSLTSEKLGVAQEFVLLMERVSESAKRRQAVGDISDFELALITAELAERTADALFLKGVVRATGTELNLLIGRSADEYVQVERDTLYVPFAESLEGLVQLGIERRADLRAAQFEADAAGERVKLASAEAVPNPRLSLSYGIDEAVLKGEDFVSASGTPLDILEVRDRDRLFAVKLSMPLPLFNRRQGVRFAERANHQRADLLRKGLERRIKAEVTAAYRRLEGSREALETYLPIIDRVSQAPSLLGRAYEVGELDLNALLVQTDRVFRVQMAFLDATIAYRVAFARLEAATGSALSVNGSIED